MPDRGLSEGAAPRVSVCLAAYNGQAWIEPQLTSILDQIGEGDEVIVVDDASNDHTVARVELFGDPRIRVVRHSSTQGHVATFEHAARLARGEFVMFSDQDDRWPRGRCELMIHELRDAALVAGNFVTIGNQVGLGPRRPLLEANSGQSWRNVLGLMVGRRPYYGSCMAVRRSLMTKVLPFPRSVEAHDHWIAIVGNTLGRVKHVESPPVTERRVHGLNLTTGRRGWRDLIRTRLRLCRHVLLARRRA